MILAPCTVIVVLNKKLKIYPLTAPAVIPATICLLKNINRIRGGMEIRTTSAKSRFHDVLIHQQ
jgi:hypothetical protein